MSSGDKVAGEPCLPIQQSSSRQRAWSACIPSSEISSGKALCSAHPQAALQPFPCSSAFLLLLQCVFFFLPVVEMRTRTVWTHKHTAPWEKDGWSFQQCCTELIGLHWLLVAIVTTNRQAYTASMADHVQVNSFNSRQLYPCSVEVTAYKMSASCTLTFYRTGYLCCSLDLLYYNVLHYNNTLCLHVRKACCD